MRASRNRRTATSDGKPGPRRRSGAGSKPQRRHRSCNEPRQASTTAAIRNEGKVTQPIEVKVPDIGDFKDVPVIEVLVKPGDTIAREDSLVTLESEKATMDVPAPAA